MKMFLIPAALAKAHLGKKWRTMLFKALNLQLLFFFICSSAMANAARLTTSFICTHFLAHQE